jgi:hypothetical protein
MSRRTSLKIKARRFDFQGHRLDRCLSGCSEPDKDRFAAQNPRFFSPIPVPRSPVSSSQIVKAFGVPLTTVKRSLDDGRLKGIKKKSRVPRSG